MIYFKRVYGCALIKRNDQKLERKIQKQHQIDGKQRKKRLLAVSQKPPCRDLKAKDDRFGLR